MNAGVKPSLLTAATRDRFPSSACGRVTVAHLMLGVFSGYSSFFQHVRPQNANIRAFENLLIISMSTLSLFRHSDRFDFMFSLRCID